MADLRTDEAREAAAFWAMRTIGDTLDDAEQASLARWLSAAPVHQTILKEMRAIYDSPALADLLDDHHVPARATFASPRHDRPAPAMWVASSRRRFAALAIAACLAIVTLGFVGRSLDWFGGFTSASRQIATLATAPGQTRDVNLRDGSVVELNGDTRLSLDFGAKERRVALADGEAFFEVAHDRRRPFVVHAGGASFTAVGTRFNVTRLGDSTILTVHEGRVRVALDTSPDAGQVYAAGARVSVESSGTRSAEMIPAPTAQPGWREGWLDAGEISVADLVTALNRRAGTAIEVSPRAAELMVRGRFRVDRPEALLHSVGLMYGLKLATHDGRQILVEANDDQNRNNNVTK